MNEMIKKFLNNHPKLDYCQRVLRYSTDKEMQAIVLGYHRDPRLLYFEERGGLYMDQYFYDIYMDYPSKGFFALLCQTLDAIRYGKKFGLVPVVTWSDRCLYKEEGVVNGSKNPFEYYFEPLSSVSRNEINHAGHVLGYHVCQRALNKETPFTVVSKTIIENGCYEEYIESNAQIWREFIRLKQPVEDYIQDSMKQIGFGEHVLGVHVRATDFNKGYVNHAVAVGQNEYIEAVKCAMKEVPSIEKIFLATDDLGTVNDFMEAFPGKVMYYNDTFRSDDGEAVHFSQSERENHKYRLGLEVMRDMMTLSKCEGLIGGLSNVCIAAQIVNRSSKNPFQYLNVIDKGFNKQGKTTYEDHFKNAGRI